MSGQRERHDDFDALVRPALDRLLRAACLLCGSTSEAEDLVQNVLARFYARGRWNAVEHPYAYLRRAISREFLSSRRRRWHGELSTNQLDDAALGSSDADDPAARLDLLRALDALAPADRLVVVLRYWDDLSVREVAALMGTTAGAVRTRSGRALARLRSALTELDPDRPVPTSATRGDLR